MAISKITFELVIELFNRGLFKGKKSILDMGDQDINLKFNEIESLINQTNKEFQKDLFLRAKNYPERPRVQSSMLWKNLGFEITNRMDIEELPRDLKQGEIILQDLNFPIKNDLNSKYDVVTDFGNNEHPFNVVESFTNMHKLCKENGLLIIYQSLFKGNGYFNFDFSFFESIAAVNNYSILFSNLIYSNNNNCVLSSVKKENLKLINLNEIDNIYFFYLFKKNNDDDFKFPYQSSGSTYPAKEYFSLKFTHENVSPEKYYLPSKIENISLRSILKIMIKKIFN